MFYIESKQEITFIYIYNTYLQSLIEHVLIKVVYDCFELGFCFLRRVFLSLIHIFQIIETAELWFKRQKFRDEHGTFSDVRVSVCASVIKPELWWENINKCTVIDKKSQGNSKDFPVYRTIPCGEDWEAFSSQ